MNWIKLILLMLGILVIPSFCFGAGSWSVDSDIYMKGSRIVTLIATADAADGSYPEYQLYANQNTTTSNTGIKFGGFRGWKFYAVHVLSDHAVTHDGSANAAVLSDTSGGFKKITTLVGYTLTNATDSSSGTITANTSTTITAPLTGGADNDWDVGDAGTWATEVTDDTDIEITMDNKDILEGNGVDVVDSDANPSLPAYINSLPASITIRNDLVLILTQPSGTETNSAVTVIKLELYE